VDQTAFAHQEFFGTSENAVKVQIWTAVSTYLLVAIMKKELRLEQSLYTILQVLSLSLFEKMPILEAFLKNICLFKVTKAANSCHYLINVGTLLLRKQKTIILISN